MFNINASAASSDLKIEQGLALNHIEAIQNCRYGKVNIGIKDLFPMLGKGFDISLKSHVDFLMGRLSGEESSMERKSAEVRLSLSSDEELSAFYKEIESLRVLVREAEKGHNEVIFKKD